MIHQSETSALPDNWFKNAPVKMLCPEAKVLLLNIVLKLQHA